MLQRFRPESQKPCWEKAEQRESDECEEIYADDEDEYRAVIFGCLAEDAIGTPQPEI
jgi:hypothetical protein